MHLKQLKASDSLDMLCKELRLEHADYLNGGNMCLISS